MSLAERLEADLKASLKAREAGKVRLATLRMVKAAVKNREIELRHPLDEAGIIDVIAREIKQRREALPDYQRSGRSELIANLEAEIAILEEYLPPALSPAELDNLITTTIAEVGAAGPSDLGKVMTALMPRVKGRADGKEVNRRVQEKLRG